LRRLVGLRLNISRRVRFELLEAMLAAKVVSAILVLERARSSTGVHGHSTDGVLFELSLRFKRWLVCRRHQQPRFVKPELSSASTPMTFDSRFAVSSRQPFRTISKKDRVGWRAEFKN
jgi:hypothetical protein